MLCPLASSLLTNGSTVTSPPVVATAPSRCSVSVKAPKTALSGALTNCKSLTFRYLLGGGASDVDGPAAALMVAPVSMSVPLLDAPETGASSISLVASTIASSAIFFPHSFAALLAASSLAVVQLASAAASLAISSTLASTSMSSIGGRSMGAC